MFVERAFGAQIVERLRVLGFKKVAGMNCGSKPPDPHMEHSRAHMYARAEEWYSRAGFWQTIVPLVPREHHS